MNTYLVKTIIIYLLFVNTFCFVLCLYDKAVSKHKSSVRVPEKAFFTLCFLGACPFMLLGMYLFRHKTRHKSFKIGIPLILIVQLAVVYFLHIYVF